MSVDRRVRQLADALSQFWRSGAGPTHDDLDRCFEDAGLTEYPTEEEHAKWRRVDAVVRQVAGTPHFRPVVGHLVELLHEQGLLDADSYFTDAPPRDIERLHRRLGAFGLKVTDDGELVGGAVSAVDEAASSILTVDVLRQHVERVKRAAIDSDIELMIGSAKELIESTAAVVLRETGTDFDRDESLSRKAKLAQQALLLHGSVHDVEGEAEKQVKTVLSSLSSIAVSIAEMRKRPGPVTVGLSQCADSIQGMPSSSPVPRSSTARC